MSHLAAPPPPLTGAARRAAWLLLIALTLAAPHLAYAERVDQKTVRAWIKRGESLFRAGRLEMALVMFRKAEPHGEVVRDRAGVRWNIARCLEELKQHPEAVEAFEAYLEFEQNPAGRKDGQAKIDELFPKAFGQMEIECNERLRIHLEHEGKETIHRCPGRWVRLREGHYRFWAEIDGRLYPPQDAAIRVGEVSRFQIPPPGLLTIETTSKGGEAYRINDDEMGALPSDQRALPPGAYRIEVAQPGEAPWRREVVLEPGEALRVLYEAPRPAPPAAARWQPWVYGASSGVALIVGGALLWSASSNAAVADDNYANYLKARRPSDVALLRAAVEGAQDKAHQQRLYGWVGLGVGGVLGALTLWQIGAGAPVALTPHDDGAAITWGMRW
ncbi:PEGA domain-containing protein [Myxococcota bacterium]|nr:PEGA domain-containing protein [Myxococcota bacterium]MBU1429040.1 PEGA domain-containing protein [Myxococcota bacterium]MBU1897117.1 PEGA domain-containing protein [Myxococcota bacterium]